MLELLDICINVTRNGPDELETIEKRLHGISDSLQIALRDHFELAL